MPADTMKDRANSNPVVSWLQLRTEEGHSPETIVKPVGDVFGSQQVILYGPDGEPIIDASGLLPVDAKRLPVFTDFTGTNVNIGFINPGIGYQLLGIRMHFNGVFAAAEILTITLRSAQGAAYDTVLFTRDLSVGSVVDLIIPFGGDEDFFETNDRIEMALSANANGRTYGITTIHELT